MNIKYKAITFAILLSPIAAMASEDYEPGDWLYDIHSGVHIMHDTMDKDVVMDSINKTIEEQPAAAGSADEGYVFPINFD